MRLWSAGARVTARGRAQLAIEQGPTRTDPRVLEPALDLIARHPRTVAIVRDLPGPCEGGRAPAHQLGSRSLAGP